MAHVVTSKTKDVEEVAMARRHAGAKCMNNPHIKFAIPERLAVIASPISKIETKRELFLPEASPANRAFTRWPSHYLVSRETPRSRRQGQDGPGLTRQIPCSRDSACSDWMPRLGAVVSLVRCVVVKRVRHQSRGAICIGGRRSLHP